MYQHEYYLTHREYYIKHANEWRENNLERSKEAHRLWDKNNRKKRQEYGMKYRSTNDSPRGRLIKILGNRCSSIDCLVLGGCTDIRCLQIDHINGGGKQEILKFKTGNNMYRYYSKHPEEAKQKLQLLCANCNWIKRAIQRESGGSPLLEHL